MKMSLVEDPGRHLQRAQLVPVEEAVDMLGAETGDGNSLRDEPIMKPSNEMAKLSFVIAHVVNVLGSGEGQPVPASLGPHLA
jgi:hypothetical protein